MDIAFPGESAEYRAARNRLLEQEIELRRAMEAVAAARRRLPPGGVVPQDYVFQGQEPDGGPVEVRLSELFAPGRDSLVIYSMMFPRSPGDDRPGPTGGQTALLPLAQGPCPSCTAFLDQLDGAAEHASQHINLAVAGKTNFLGDLPEERLPTWTRRFSRAVPQRKPPAAHMPYWNQRGFPTAPAVRLDQHPFAEVAKHIGRFQK